MAATFPKATKLDPLYQLPDGLYKRLLERDAKTDPEAVRASDGDKMIWLKKVAECIEIVESAK